MPKRLTDTNKWRDPWFAQLDAETKLAYLYLLDTCDHAGVIEISFKHLQFETGYSGTEAKLLNALAGKITFLNGKCFILKFVDFQYKNFDKAGSACIKSARELLAKHGIQYPVNLNPINSLPEGFAKASIRLAQGLDKASIRTKEEEVDMVEALDIVGARELERDDEATMNVEFDKLFK